MNLSSLFALFSPLHCSVQRGIQPMLPVLCTILILCTNMNAQPIITSPKREFRGAWIAVVSNVDWPINRTDDIEKQQRDFIAILNELQRANFNAIFFQVRPSADAVYQSGIEPWSEWLTGMQGRSPNYDPLAFAIREARQRGMEVHAWFNPYRSVVSAGSSVSAQHISRTRPEWHLAFSSPNRLLNPGIPDVRQYITGVIMDVVRRYDIDGIHFDDYFYPYSPNNITTQDAGTFNQFGTGFTDIGEWRRSNVNALISMVHDSIRAVKSHIKFGISPFGIYRNGVPTGIVGMDAFNVIYCDPLAWLRAGSVDYLIPQLYWQIGGAQDYNALSSWWSSQTTQFNRHLYSGNGLYRLLGTTDWPISQITQQIEINRFGSRTQGAVMFSANQLLNNIKGITTAFADGQFRWKAFPPTMPWKDNVPPLPPQSARGSVRGDSTVLEWSAPAPAGDADTARRYAVYRFPQGTPLSIDQSQFLVGIVSAPTTRFIERNPLSGTNFTYIITALDDMFNESADNTRVSISLTSSTQFQHAFGFVLENPLPNPFSGYTRLRFSIPTSLATSVHIHDINGRIVYTSPEYIYNAGNHELVINFDALNVANGVYIAQLRAGVYRASVRLHYQR